MAGKMSDSVMDAEETLATRRSKRSTAGNRMEAALAEMALEDLSKDADDDNDFMVEQFEEDAFESDFESTDEEAQQETENAEKAAQEDDKRVKKAARTRVERATAAAHARQKVTFNPTAETSSGVKDKTKNKPKRRVSLGLAINAETGEVIVDDSAAGKRSSKRQTTIANTSATFKRILKSEEKKAQQAPKKTKTETHTLTQAELIARALDNEEGNIVEHRDYLLLEEEKRKRARVVRASVTGPLVRWVSRMEEVKVKVPVEAEQQQSEQQQSSSLVGGYAYPYYFGQAGMLYGQPVYQLQPAAQTPGASTSSQDTSIPSTRPPQETERMEKVAKSYVVHETGQHEGAPKPNWGETMQAVFGDHVRWEDVRVYAAKGRPMSQPRQICPITGMQAKYIDPRTGVPYANVGAYKMLTALLKHEYVWSAELGCYTRGESISMDVT